MFVCLSLVMGRCSLGFCPPISMQCAVPISLAPTHNPFSQTYILIREGKEMILIFQVRQTILINETYQTSTNEN